MSYAEEMVNGMHMGFASLLGGQQLIWWHSRKCEYEADSYVGTSGDYNTNIRLIKAKIRSLEDYKRSINEGLQVVKRNKNWINYLKLKVYTIIPTTHPLPKNRIKRLKRQLKALEEEQQA